MYHFSFKQLLYLPQPYQDFLVSFNNDLFTSNLTPEEFIIRKLKAFNISIIETSSSMYANDDGIDFYLKLEKVLFACQLKYWKKPICYKQIKQIYGDMFLNETLNSINKDYLNTVFLLLVPFASKSIYSKLALLNDKNFYVIYGVNFVQFLMNPMDTLTKLQLKKG